LARLAPRDNGVGNKQLGSPKIASGIGVAPMAGMVRRLALSAVAISLTACAPDVVDETNSGDSAAPMAETCSTEHFLSPFQAQGGEVIDGQCLADPPLPSPEGSGAACMVIDAWMRSPGGDCACDVELGRTELGVQSERAARLASESRFAREFGWSCFCGVRQLAGDAGKACQDQAGEPTQSGFCYVDPTANPPIGNPELTAPCPQDMKHLLRFTGGTMTASSEAAASSEGLFILCDVACQ
jgi:hypothetical protein